MRLIDADELEQIIQKQVGECKIKVFDPSVNLILQDIGNAPTIEAKPVQHGRNISCMNPVDGFLCSECHTKIEGYYKVVYDEDTEDYNHYEYEFKYCPNCGARMDGE